MREPRRLTTLWASTASYRDSFTFSYVFGHLTVSFLHLEIQQTACLLLKRLGWAGSDSEYESPLGLQLIFGSCSLAILWMNSLQNLELYQLHRTELVKKSLAIFETWFLIVSATGLQSSIRWMNITRLSPSPFVMFHQLQKYSVMMWSGSICLGLCPEAGSCELSIEPAGSINGGNFPEHLCHHHLKSNAP
jgi:hypothetical protein